MEARLNISNMRAQFGSVQGFMGVTCMFSYPNPALSLGLVGKAKLITITYKMFLPGFPRPLPLLSFYGENKNGILCRPHTL